MTRFQIDADDVILRTGEQKIRWLKIHADEIPATGHHAVVEILEHLQPSECSRTVLVPVIGRTVYDRMTEEVYGVQGTKQTSPMEGAREGIEALAKIGSVYVVTARNAQHTNNVCRWLRTHGFSSHVYALSSTKDPADAALDPLYGSEKAAIARYNDADVLIDDDARHMPEEPVEGLACLLFGGAQRRDVHQHVTVVKTWADVIAYAANNVESHTANRAPHTG